MFVIPCKYNKENDTIFKCVDSIKRFYPNEKIVVVDSCSDDKSYFSQLNVFDIIEGNSNYEIGAYLKAYEKYDSEEIYYNIHDSLILNNTIPKEYINRGLVTIQWFDNVWDDYEQQNWAKQIFNIHKLQYNENFYGCFGTMFICVNSIFKKLLECGVSNFRPTNKKQSCGMERVLGILFTNLGYDLRICALQGKHINFTHMYDDSVVKKIFKGRV